MSDGTVDAGGWLIVTPRFGRYSLAEGKYDPDLASHVVKTRYLKKRPDVLKDGEMAIRIEAKIPASAFTPRLSAEVTF